MHPSSIAIYRHQAAHFWFWCVKLLSIRVPYREDTRMTRPVERDAIYRGRRYSGETIELCIRWYISHRLSYGDLTAMMAERDVIVAHTTIMRWVLRYVPEYECRWARFSRPPGESWRMDETAVSVRGGRHYLFRAVDKTGKSIGSLLCNDRK